MSTNKETSKDSHDVFEQALDLSISSSQVSKDDIKRMIAILKKALDSIPKERVEYKN